MGARIFRNSVKSFFFVVFQFVYRARGKSSPPPLIVGVGLPPQRETGQAYRARKERKRNRWGPTRRRTVVVAILASNLSLRFRQGIFFKTLHDVRRH